MLPNQALKLTVAAGYVKHGEHRSSTKLNVISMNSFRWLHYESYQRRSLVPVR